MIELAMKTGGTRRAVAAPVLVEEAAWRQVLARDAAAEFFYAVRTTGVYCRPGCASRRPARENVTFFRSVEAAEAAGFRACLRCEPRRVGPKPDALAGAVSRAVEYLDAQAEARVNLEELAAVAGVGRFALLRGFQRVLGVTPAEYARAKKVARFREVVRGDGKMRAGRAAAGRITDAIYEAGFGSSSRVYEDGGRLGMRPKTMQAGGAGEVIRYAIADSALGRMLVAATERGICLVAFDDSDARLKTALVERYSKAEFVRDDAALARQVRLVASHLTESPSAEELPLDVRATAFQERVWKELSRIPRGKTLTYGEIARRIGRPKAVRAVGAACGANPVAPVIPCHRAVGSDGKLHGYRWGLERKKKLLEAEAR